ncbi:unnamed protein product [Toxocara canis]|uniref:TWiK family of potassium channels protein 7 n=1 Tax=Toxocara canis TaxID=6265 RepID=A0A183UHZ8_TOXCA|nr:unnamed protein product [Toxocara canis]
MDLVATLRLSDFDAFDLTVHFCRFGKFKLFTGIAKVYEYRYEFNECKSIGVREKQTRKISRTESRREGGCGTQDLSPLSPYYGDGSIDELEQHELDDHVGDIPQSFVRRQRREALFASSMGHCNAVESGWSRSEMLTVPDKEAYAGDSTQSDECSKDSDEESETRGVKKSERSSRLQYAKLILPHVGLVLLTCAYTVIGALVFYSVEQPHEMATKRRQLDMIYEREEEFVNSLLTLAMLNETRREVWTQVARHHMHNMSDHLFTAFEKFFLTSAEVRANDTVEIWSFSTSIFFAVTVVTTIGYGNPVPVTQFGRMMCIIFSLFGIPLTLVTIADIGKFLSEHLIWMYGNYLKLKHFLCRRHRGKKERREHVCEQCKKQGLSANMQIVEEQRIPAMLVLTILVLYTALGGVLMSHLEPWSFFTSFYWSFITMTTVALLFNSVGFGDLMPRRDEYMYVILLYIVLG